MENLETSNAARSADTGSKLATLGQVKNVLDYSKDKITELKGDVALEDQKIRQELSVERERINSIIDLENGSTTGDAELQDIRVGADGKSYTSAGDAVRGKLQILKAIYLS